MRAPAFGRPGSEVIPTGWEDAHRPVAAATFTATIALRRVDAEASTDWDPETEQTGTAGQPAAYFTGPCRIQALTNDAREVEVAEDEITVVSYRISIDADQAVMVGDYGTITDSTDTALNGRRARVTSIVRGSLRFQRDFYATIDD